MRSLSYSGLHGQPCFCDYRVIPAYSLPGGRPGAIFVQRSPLSSSITNNIEIIASSLLKQDLLGVLSKSLRFFEHYPANLQPLVDWQEVSFSQTDGRFLKNDLWSRASRKLFSVKPDYWSVGQPSWSPVGPGLKAELQRLV